MSKAVFTFGRFSPPTVGHKKLVDAVYNHAQRIKGDHYIFSSHSQDAKKNPLSHHEKVGFLRKFFPHANVPEEKDVRTPIDAMKHLEAKGHKSVTMIVGSDRVQAMHNLLHAYNGKEYNFDHIEVKSAGHRDPDADGVEGMSASKMRAAAQAKDFNKFREGVPNPHHAKDLYDAVRRGMKLESAQTHHKALFLVGGPGSGKDILIKSGLEESGMIEVSLDKLHKTICEQKSIRELDDHRSVFINGNADDYSKVDVCRKVLEHMGYETSMIFVYTEDRESKRRNDLRIQSGAKTFSEEARKSKYDASVRNMTVFAEDFDTFFLYDNSRDFNKASDLERKEMVGWTKELFEGVSDFISRPNKALIINELFAQTFVEGDESSSVRKAAAAAKAIKKASRPDEGGGIATSAKNRSEPVVAEAKESEDATDAPKKKKVFRKQAVAPSSYYDSKIGTVPSGGIGLTAYKVESKTFSSFRKSGAEPKE